jgi:long-chain acyl-CoA synthetase
VSLKKEKDMSEKPASDANSQTITDEEIFVPFPTLMAQAAQRFPDKEVIKVDGVSLTWKEFLPRINKVANLLRDRGIGRGDKVAILARSSLEYVTVFLGTLSSGACIVPLSGMASSIQLKGMMTDSDAKMLFASSATLSLIEPFKGDLPQIKDDGYISFDFDEAGWVPFEAAIAEASTAPVTVDIQPTDAFNLIYSSGTTGVPKGIEQSHDMRFQHVVRFQAMGLNEEAICLVSTALYSNTTLVAMLPPIAMGGRVIVMPKFNVGQYLKIAEAERATHTMLVPVQYQRIMAAEDFDRYDLSNFQVKLSTSAPLRENVKRDIVARWPGKMIEIYGMTEGGVGTILSATEFPDKLASVGRAGEGSEIRILDDEGNELPQGAIGEIAGRSTAMMTGYHNRHDLTEDMIWRAADGAVFFKSGDMGRLDEDGFLYLLDRKKDMILSGGFNIYAADIEAELVKHPSVADVAVIAIPSEEWGETPLGLVVLASGASDTAAAIKDWVNERLGKTQRVSEITFRDDLPRSTIGKILKRELREEYLKTL